MAPKHILIVGDPLQDVRNIDYLIEVSGCRVTRVTDAREAVDSLVWKKIAFQKLDLILINQIFLLVQFMEIFNGALRLREKYPIIVFDPMNIRQRFQQMFEPVMDDFNIRLCDGDHYLEEIEKALDLSFRDIAFH